MTFNAPVYSAFCIIPCSGYCGRPELLSTESNGSVPIVVCYDDLAPMEVRFSCPPGYELIGPNSANCTENGDWKPDPGQLMCNVSSSEGCNC